MTLKGLLLHLYMSSTYLIGGSKTADMVLLIALLLLLIVRSLPVLKFSPIVPIIAIESSVL